MRAGSLCTCLMTAAACHALGLYPDAAVAGGGIAEPGYFQTESYLASAQSPGGAAASAASGTVSVADDGIKIAATAGGAAYGIKASSGATVWSVTDVETPNGSSSWITSTSLTATFSKGSNSLSAGQSETIASVQIGGQTYVVAKEVAIAFARSTIFGATSAVEVDASYAVTGSVPSSPFAPLKAAGPR